MKTRITQFKIAQFRMAICGSSSDFRDGVACGEQEINTKQVAHFGLYAHVHCMASNKKQCYPSIHIVEQGGISYICTFSLSHI